MNQVQTVEPDLYVEFDEDIFNDVYVPLLEDMTPVQILFGGSSSGKSVFYAYRCVYDILAGGRNYLVVRKIADTIGKSARTEIIKAIKVCGLESEFNIPKSDFTITCSNGYQIMFTGLDDAEKLKSITPALGVITDIWVEEATEISRDDMKMLDKRLRGGDEDTVKRLMFTFNPILQNHWIYTEHFKPINWKDDQREYRSSSLSITKTTYKDNRFLTAQDIGKLENESDTYYYNVYTLGNWGVLGNVIFTNWSVEDLSYMRDQFTNHRYGGDFGYGGNPAAVTITHYDKNHKTIYIYDEIWEKGLTNDILAERTKKKIGSRSIVWDSAEPKSIAELKQHGVTARGARKGQDSVNFGINWLKQQKIVIDEKCTYHISEFSSLKWKEDRKTGEVLDQPVGPDHCIDAIRYAYEDDMTARGSVEVGDSPLS